VATKKQDYDLAFTNLRNNQNISAYNLFTNLAETQKKTDAVKSALLYVLAGECKSKQGKDNENEILEAGKLFLNFGKKDKSYKAKGAFLCASKCFLKAGKYDDAKDAFSKAKEISSLYVSTQRPVIIVEDSKAITIKLENYIKKLGYDDSESYETGKDGIVGCKNLIKRSKNPIVLLDMGLPDMGGDKVAEKLLAEKLDLQIIIITADEKTTKRVNKTISSGVTAFIQKPFTMDEVKKSIDLAESEYSLS
jgi:CheY-like chemotaxis protein